VLRLAEQYSGIQGVAFSTYALVSKYCLKADHDASEKSHMTRKESALAV
jgi:hypothetical protein